MECNFGKNGDQSQEQRSWQGYAGSDGIDKFSGFLSWLDAGNKGIPDVSSILRTAVD
jgi:hypothetical protein